MAGSMKLDEGACWLVGWMEGLSLSMRWCLFDSIVFALFPSQV